MAPRDARPAPGPSPAPADPAAQPHPSPGAHTRKTRPPHLSPAPAPSAPIPPEEATRLETDGDCRNATPGNRLAFIRCVGDYDSFD